MGSEDDNLADVEDEPGGLFGGHSAGDSGHNDPAPDQKGEGVGQGEPAELLHSPQMIPILTHLIALSSYQ